MMSWNFPVHFVYHTLMSQIITLFCIITSHQFSLQSLPTSCAFLVVVTGITTHSNCRYSICCHAIESRYSRLATAEPRRCLMGMVGFTSGLGWGEGQNSRRKWRLISRCRGQRRCGHRKLEHHRYCTRKLARQRCILMRCLRQSTDRALLTVGIADLRIQSSSSRDWADSR